MSEIWRWKVIQFQDKMKVQKRFNKTFQVRRSNFESLQFIAQESLITWTTRGRRQSVVQPARTKYAQWIIVKSNSSVVKWISYSLSMKASDPNFRLDLKVVIVCLETRRTLTYDNFVWQKTNLLFFYENAEMTKEKKPNFVREQTKNYVHHHKPSKS